MARIKGFYFSLDAMMASTILLAAVGMIASYTPQDSESSQPVELNYLETSSMQKISEWNKSMEKKNQTVIEYIYRNRIRGDNGEADKICKNYFNITKNYTIFYYNKTTNSNLCGGLKTQLTDQLKSEKIALPDIKENSSYQGAKMASMVIKD
jgi:hypothetical protein